MIEKEDLLESMGEDHDETSSRLGMWLFLFSEILLFGGLFLLYSMFRYKHPTEFHRAAMELDLFLGTLNTLILLTSSYTVVLSISAMQKGNRKGTLLLLAVTILFGAIFLLNKYLEWSAKIHHGIYPGSPELLAQPHGEILFFGLYYVMTGLHGLHVVAGMVLLSVISVFVMREKISATHYIALENAALYWHLVDIIWIFLFPLFYLVT